MERSSKTFLIAAICCVVSYTHAQITQPMVLKLIEETRTRMKGPCDDRSNLTHFDFIIVGAGAAGSVLASRLSETENWTILLLEAGDDETYIMDIPMMANLVWPSVDWNYKLEPAPAGCPLGPKGRCTYPRGKVMGGSTTVNSMIFSRGTANDFDNWKDLGNDGWGYDDVLTYFRMVENMTIDELKSSSCYGTDGPLPISYTPFSTRLTQIMLQAAEEMDIQQVDYNCEQQMGVSRVQTMTRGGQRWSANRAYLSGAAGRSNLHVRKRSLAVKLLLEEGSGRALGVRYERDGVVREAFARKEVLLSAGAINSPQLLMLSGVGPAKHLQELDIPLLCNLPVGQNLQDHVTFYGFRMTLNESVSVTASEIFNRPENYVNFLLNGEGPLTSINGVEMMYFYQAGKPKYESQPNMEMYLLQFPPVVTYQNTPIDIYRNMRDKNAILPAFFHLLPRSKGNVSLASADIHQQPKIFPNYYDDEDDLSDAVASVRKMQELFQTNAFQRVGASLFEEPFPGCEEETFQSDGYWECIIKRYSVTTFHPCCTCRMGPVDDAASVVNPDLKVKGFSNLRVVDASVFPEMIAAHLEAPTLMVAEKAADLIKRDHL